MIDSDIFTENLLALVKEHGVHSAASLTELINLRAGTKSIDHSYVARILKSAKKGESVNPSLDKAGAIAAGFNISLSEMLVKNYLTSGKANYKLDDKKVEAAFRHVESFCEQANVDNSEFKARAFNLHYNALVLNNTEDLAVKLHFLAKEYDI